MGLLKLESIDKIFGGLKAVQSVSLGIEPGTIFGLIGPNGAGKTTIFNVITGVYVPETGRVWFDGEDITGWSTARVASRGIARTFQNIRLFRSMTVEENVMVAGHHLHKASVWSAVTRSQSYTGDEKALSSRAHELLEVMGLRNFANDVAGGLPYGSQRRLEIARALMLSPQLLLLDEPAAGMNSQEAGELKRQIRFLRDQLKLTVMLVEHNMSVVMSVSDHVHVVNFGQTVAEGSPEAVKKHPKVIEVYLGQETPTPTVEGSVLS